MRKLSGIVFTCFFVCLASSVLKAQDDNLKLDSAYIKNQLNFMLFQYCDSGNVDVVKKLLYYGAEADIANDYGVTPLMYAVQSGSYELVELLLNQNANPNKKDRKSVV